MKLTYWVYVNIVMMFFKKGGITMEDQRKRILELVKTGTLTIEEALTLLEALDKEQQHKSKTQNEERNQAEEQHQNEHNEQQSSTKDKEQANTFTEAKDKIFDFVGGALKKIKDFDFPLNQSVEISHVFQQSSANINSIKIDVDHGHVRFKQWDQEDVRIECEVKVFRTDDFEEGRKFFLNNSTFTLDDEQLQFTTHSKWMKVDTIVYVPQHKYETIVLRTFNGSIHGEDMTAVKTNIKTLNGKIFIKDSEINRLEAETANGTIDFEKSNINEVEAQTMNGEIKWNGAFVTSDFESFNGNISISLTDEYADTLHAKTVTGNIEIILPDKTAVQGECKSNFGNFMIALEGIERMDEKKEMIQKQLRFSRNYDTNKHLYIFADAKTGAVSIKEGEMDKKKEPITNEAEETQADSHEE